MTTVHLTRRAMADMDAIDRFSVDRWGPRVAADYLAEFSAALGRLGSAPKLLVKRSDYGGRLRFYPVGRHILVCDVLAGDIIVLCVWHGSMDILARLDRFEPQLALEAELLASQLKAVAERG